MFKDLGLSYLQAMHGVQTAIAHEMNMGKSTETTPKHLRVGVNSAMIDGSALTYLMIQKGLITKEEYEETLRLFANQEVASYEERNPGFKFR